MLVVRKELDNALLRTLLHLVGPSLVRNFEVNSITGRGINATHLPRASISDSAFGLSN